MDSRFHWVHSRFRPVHSPFRKCYSRIRQAHSPFHPAHLKIHFFHTIKKERTFPFSPQTIENVDFHCGGRFPRARLQPLPSRCSVQGLQFVLIPLESPPPFQSTEITVDYRMLACKKRYYINRFRNDGRSKTPNPYLLKESYLNLN